MVSLCQTIQTNQILQNITIPLIILENKFGGLVFICTFELQNIFHSYTMTNSQNNFT